MKQRIVTKVLLAPELAVTQAALSKTGELFAKREEKMRLIEENELNHVSGGEDTVLSDVIIQAARHVVTMPWEVVAQVGPFAFGLARNQDGDFHLYQGIGAAAGGALSFSNENHDGDEISIEGGLGKDGKKIGAGVSVGYWMPLADQPVQDKAQIYADRMGMWMPED